MSKTGRPKKEVDLAKLRALSLIGASHELIASELGISHDTLTRNFSAEVNAARAKGKLKVLGKAFQLAAKGNVRLLEIFLTNWLGFSLRPEVAVSVVQNASPTLSAAELRQRLAAVGQLFEVHRAEIEDDHGLRPPLLP